MKIPLLTLDKPNANGRIYPKEVIEKALQKYRDEYVIKTRAFVTKKPPESPTVNLLDTVGVIKEIIVVDNTVMADVEFLNVPEAKIFETALYSGKLHLRTAGIGSIHKQDNGTYTVGEDYQLTSCFLTDDPA